MSQSNNQANSIVKWPYRISFGTILLWVAVVCITVTIIVIKIELSQIKRSLISQVPMPVKEVAQQFKKQTTLGPVTVTVKDVRYSPKKDSYKIDFSWTDSTTGKIWNTDVQLINDTYGTYFGMIRNDPFIKPLGYKDGYPVAVESPSLLRN
jgi:hypothetical protein